MFLTGTDSTPSGQPRNADFTTGIGRLHSNDYNVTTERGFTGHEHLDETFLIHMNGRVYDYKLAKVLSVDTVISSPTNSQSINRHTPIWLIIRLAESIHRV